MNGLRLVLNNKHSNKIVRQYNEGPKEAGATSDANTHPAIVTTFCSTTSFIKRAGKGGTSCYERGSIIAFTEV